MLLRVSIVSRPNASAIFVGFSWGSLRADVKTRDNKAKKLHTSIYAHRKERLADAASFEGEFGDLGLGALGVPGRLQ